MRSLANSFACASQLEVTHALDDEELAFKDVLDSVTAGPRSGAALDGDVDEFEASEIEQLNMLTGVVHEQPPDRGT